MARSLSPIRIILLAGLSVGLAACGSSGGGTTTPPPQLTISTLPTGYAVSFQSQAGIEAINFTSAATEGVLVSNIPSGSMTTTAAGFDFAVPGITNGAVSFDTRGGGRQFTGCAPCVSAMSAVYVTTTLTNNAASSLSYTTYGTWELTGFGGLPTYKGVFAGGIPTTTAQVPTTGTATYNGKLAGFVGDIGSAAGQQHSLNGDVAMTANFGANTIAGNVTNIRTTSISNSNAALAGISGTTNNIALTGGTITGANFAGTATATTTVGATVDVTGATGRFGGQFYGPNAAELAGTLAMTGPGSNIVGSFGAKK